MITVIGGLKGGIGKTTIATNLTVLRSQAGKRVLLVDTDEETRSASAWSEQRNACGHETPWTTIQLTGPTIFQEIKKLMKDYDDVIIDVGPQNNHSQRSALVNADVFVVPFKPRPYDIWTATTVKQMISEIKVVNPNLRAYAIVNQADYSGDENKESQEILAEFPEFIPIPGCIANRKCFGKSAKEGLGINELKILDKKAMAEMQSLYDLIYYS